MRVVTVNNTKSENAVKSKKLAKRFFCFISKIRGIELVDADAILKSRDWPYLWHK